MHLDKGHFSGGGVGVFPVLGSASKRLGSAGGGLAYIHDALVDRNSQQERLRQVPGVLPEWAGSLSRDFRGVLGASRLRGPLELSG